MTKMYCISLFYEKKEICFITYELNIKLYKDHTSTRKKKKGKRKTQDKKKTLKMSRCTALRRYL